MAAARGDHRKSCVAHKQYESLALQNFSQGEIFRVKLGRLTEFGEFLEEPTLHVAQRFQVAFARLYASRTATMGRYAEALWPPKITDSERAVADE